ncbi:MAG: DUF2442 domain-containing protein [Oscillospiraceae bacterium]|nr:DUF2442 domain-containing protein [Oscillospiraceae bacterium]
MESYYPVAVEPLNEYKLLITFDNEEKRILDVTPYLTESLFAPLKSLAIFNSVKISPISLEWSGGIDMCPDELYYNSILA